MRERARQYEENPDLVKTIVAEGCEKARSIAKATMEEVRSAMGLGLSIGSSDGRNFAGRTKNQRISRPG